MPTTPLTTHFTLQEMIASQTAAREGIDNTPPPAVVAELRKTCELLETVRMVLGSRPILVSSGYRSPQLNARIGGSPTSQHMTGQAADFTCPGFGDPYAVCKKIMAADLPIPYDQLIWEYGDWVHISQANPARLMALTINNSGTKSGIA